MSETNLRLVLVKRGCPHCFEAVKAVNYLNKFLREFKQIIIMDNYEWEEFGFKTHPIMDKFDPKDFDGYPYIYIDGQEVGPAPAELLIITIAKIVEEDLIMGIEMGAIQIG